MKKPTANSHWRFFFLKNLKASKIVSLTEAKRLLQTFLYLAFFFFLKGSHYVVLADLVYVDQAGLQPKDLPALASKILGLKACPTSTQSLKSFKYGLLSPCSLPYIPMPSVWFIQLPLIHSFLSQFPFTSPGVLRLKRWCSGQKHSVKSGFVQASGLHRVRELTLQVVLWPP